MEIDGRPSSSGKPDSSMGPPRLSLLSPPKDGRMGTVPQRAAGKLGSFRTSAHSTPVQQIGLSGYLSSGTLSHRGGSWDSSNYRTMLSCPSTPSSPQTSVSRTPISISNLLMKSSPTLLTSSLITLDAYILFAMPSLPMKSRSTEEADFTVTSEETKLLEGLYNSTCDFNHNKTLDKSQIVKYKDKQLTMFYHKHCSCP
ncbi:probable E3 SUMO-protein ligase RNF212 [Amblyraja radiata]|uniref:probable E3 SUMO-protein ligase RNF212 n=1 Tax=Amblyraja radiata TaxID=386614 RepID=UPI0014027CF5|nr:probable E3 SUMO-protein ligase RNF212 [Amblyraja radiata]